MPRGDQGGQAPSPPSPIDPLPDKFIHHGGFRQGGGVTEIGGLAAGDAAQDAAHDLAGAGLG